MKKDKTKFYLTLSTMGLEMGLSLVVGFFLGQFLDKKLDITPWGSIMGLFLGLAAAFRSICQKEKGYLKKSFQKQIGVKKLPRIILIGCSLLFFIF